MNLRREFALLRVRSQVVPCQSLEDTGRDTLTECPNRATTVYSVPEDDGSVTFYPVCPKHGVRS